MPEYFLQRRGHPREEGPFCEEELLDMLNSGEISHADWCRPRHTPRACRVGDLFQIISPEPQASRHPAPIVPSQADAADDAQGDEEDDEVFGETDEAFDEDEEAFEDEPAVDDEEDDERDDDDDDEGDTDEEDEWVNEGDNLELPEEEELIYHGSPSWLSYSSQLGLITLVLAAGWWAGAFGLWWVVGSVGLALWLLARVLLHRATRDYMVTTERVESSIGLVRRVTRSIHLRDLQAIRLHQSGLLGFLGIGTVIFSDGGPEKDEVVFDRVPRVRRLIACVREWQRRHSRV